MASITPIYDGQGGEAVLNTINAAITEANKVDTLVNGADVRDALKTLATANMLPLANVMYDGTRTAKYYLDNKLKVQGTTSKASTVDAGYLGEESFDDDFGYRCTVAGTAGNATWKRWPLTLI